MLKYVLRMASVNETSYAPINPILDLLDLLDFAALAQLVRAAVL